MCLNVAENGRGTAILASKCKEIQWNQRETTEMKEIMNAGNRECSDASAHRKYDQPWV